MARADQEQHARQQNTEQNRADGERAAQAERTEQHVRQAERIVIRLDDLDDDRRRLRLLDGGTQQQRQKAKGRRQNGSLAFFPPAQLCGPKSENASSARVRTATPLAPFGRYGLASSTQAVPAMSMCTHGRPAVNSPMNSAAVMEPA